MRLEMVQVKIMGKFLQTITLNRVNAICLAPFGIYVKEDYIANPKTITHEGIHWQQQIEMLYLLFYIWYIIEYLVKLLFYGKRAYVNISFEREAYSNDRNVVYIFTRHRYAWIKRIFK